MSSPENSPNGLGRDKLDSVRRLEAELRDQKGAQEASERRLAEARAEAERVVAEARREGLLDAEKRKKLALEEADRESEGILRSARERMASLREWADADRASATEEALRRLLPGEGG